MVTPNSSRTLFVSLLGVLALAAVAAAQRPNSGRPAGGGGSVGGGSRPSMGAVSRPSMPSVSRPSAPAVSRPSTPTTSRAAPSPSYQRGNAAPAPQARPQPAPQPPPQPRYEQPSAPRYEQPSTPRYEQPTAPRYEQPSAPRYEQPSAPRHEVPGTSGYDAPSSRSADPRLDAGNSSTPRYGSSRDASGRIYDGGASGRGGLSGARLDGPGSRGDYRGAPAVDGSGRIDPARIDRSTPSTYQPRVWQPNPVVDLSGAVRAPRIGVPSISGSRSGPEAGLSSGRLARAGLDSARPSDAVPHPAVNGDSLRARYGAADGQKNGAGRVPSADARKDSGSREPQAAAGERGTGLSSGRTGTAARKSSPGTPTPLGDAGSRARGQAKRTIDGETGRGQGSNSSAGGVDGRVASGQRRAGEVERTNPETGHRLRAAGNAGHAAGTVAGGIVIGTGSGYYGGCWDPCYDPYGGYGWYWNSCWYGGWWWSWSFGWPYGSCWWGWPGYGYGYPWGYSSSYWGWCSSPWIYTTVIYEDYDPPVVVQAPAREPEVAPAGNAPAAGAVPKVAPEIRAGLEASADEALVAGDTAFREGRYSDAVRHYARAVEFSPERGSLWLILSDALFATGDYHYAAYAFRKSLELDATLLETLVDKHGWYTDPTEFDRHIAWSEAYLRDHVLDEDARLILAANYLFAKRFASASDVLESAFGAGILETQAGKLVIERSRRALGVNPR
ncbi:MAG: hypothetical protein NTY35_14650 [Planctomycetota bacterium]|nr:hypothetical protein [Planctomycetota bacterium]